MESSSESDTFDRTRGLRSRGRNASSRSRRDSHRTGPDAPAISEKINTLASTLQDTNRNLNKVDRMLGQYREHTDDQAEAMATLRDNLEESIAQLQNQRLHSSSGVRSASASTLHTSDLEAGYGSEGQRFYPTSPLKDYGRSESAGEGGARRRSRSATVRFRDSSLPDGDVHVLHQSFRDLRSDQLRLGDDMDREILRRNRSDIDTRRALENLSEHLTTSQRQDSVSSRVEKRLQEIEREMRSERESVSDRRPEQRGIMSDELQEALRRREARDLETEEAVKNKLLRSESEKTKMEAELERARRQLDQSEGGRGALLQQVEEMRVQLLRTEKERMDLQREISQLTTQPRATRMDREERGAGLGLDRSSELEREVQELRAQLSRTSVLSEVEDLRRTLERKDRERTQLCNQVEVLSSELARREQQQLRMLEQLKEIQGRSEACAAERARALLRAEEAEARLQDSSTRREELKTRAQEAVRQWRAKCKRMERDMEEMRGQAQLDTEKAKQACKERELSRAQLKAFSQQTEGVRRELAEVLGRLARSEEEVLRKDVELSETRARHLGLEQEVREVREASIALEEEAQRQSVLQVRLREENQSLEERAEAVARRSQRDQEELHSLQAAMKELTSARAQLTTRLAEEAAFRTELQRSGAEGAARLAAAQEQRASLGQQLELEREVHQSELASLRATVQNGRAKQDRDIQETLRLCMKERNEMEHHLKEIKADAASDKELVRALRVKLDRMKTECDRMTEELNEGEEQRSHLRGKYQLLKQELDDKVKCMVQGEERRRGSEEAVATLEDRLSRLDTEQESILSSVAEEIDAACRALFKDSQDKLKAISLNPGLQKDPHRWLAETKTKLRWLCEEVSVHEARERKLRRQVQQDREQLKGLRQSRDSERQALLQRLDQQEKLLHSISTEKKELLEKTRRKENEMRSLQDRILDLEMSTRLAVDHLESVPEKLCLLDNFKDLEESQRQKELVEQRYIKYKEIVGVLQHQLDESKRQIQECRDDRLDATTQSIRLTSLSSSIRGPSALLTSSMLTDTTSPHKHLASPDCTLDYSLSLDRRASPAVNGCHPHSVSDHLNSNT
ncbi:centrosomal protein of 128 kDa-like isoform X1 [Salvelinus namaycush]|uniref:Centrosomal protein of 128 kDa-like isoform X1 n=1 Tax=Salvelinus namaycush TaxID=8040 RepID=A0A8U0PGS4_SALNM|nr:centrosomal protein of 128 kDa-like isoform X1 [Salvelinus namaycush]